MSKISQISFSLLIAGLLSALPAHVVLAQKTSRDTGVTPSHCEELLSRGGVFIFFDPACPICAEYFPTIERLSAKYVTGEPFYLVFKQEDEAAIKSFVEDYHPHCQVLCDVNSVLQSALGARITPEAFLLKRGKIVYSGRIDDRYESIGHRRNVIRSCDLEKALESTAKGELPVTKTAAAVGCYIEVERSEKTDGAVHGSK